VLEPLAATAATTPTTPTTPNPAITLPYLDHENPFSGAFVSAGVKPPSIALISPIEFRV